MTDIELMIKVRGENSELSRKDAVQKVANECNMVHWGVSGRVTRAEGTIAGRVALMQWQQQHGAHVNQSRIEIENIIHEHQNELRAHKALFFGSTYHAVFLSDTHFPYHDVDALALTYEILADLPNVAYISTLSDGFDFSTLSRWPDGRKAADRALDSDLRGVLDTYTYHTDTLSQIAPNALLLALIGNHDIRLVNGNTGTEDYLQLGVMQRLAKHGVRFLGDFSKENIIEITPGLVWYHGNHARKNRIGGAKANYEHVKHTLQSSHDFTLVFGHVHDPVHYQDIKAHAYGAGCLCQLQPHYNRHAQHWQQGIVVTQVTSTGHLTYNINFAKVDGELTAFNPFTGKTYATNLQS